MGLFKKAEPDVTTVAKMVLNDFQRGRLPYFVNPKPYFPEEEQKLFEEKILADKVASCKNDDLVEQNLDEISCVHVYDKEDTETRSEPTKTDAVEKETIDFETAESTKESAETESCEKSEDQTK